MRQLITAGRGIHRRRVPAAQKCALTVRPPVAGCGLLCQVDRPPGRC